MRGVQKSEKVPGKHCLYRRLGCGPNYRQKFGGHYLFLIQYKNKIRMVISPDWEMRFFESRQVISPSKARHIIGWMARYLAMSDPDPISLAIASTKTHAHRIAAEQNKIAKELGL